ncbi:MAG TPA: MFS transporter [Acetobacteraceae bacterium]|jgi:FSR family fosmidomycin resistance protein-like MFS transporter|nr:MFS transporter [Acetobacteraceae bacterium]
MSSSTQNTAVRVTPAATTPSAEGTVIAVLLAISFSHMLNDMMQSLLPAIYPILKTSYALNYVQIGFITLAFNITASLLQPVVGLVTDKRPMPFSLPVGMGLTLVGLLMLASASSYPLLLGAAALVGCGSSVFHPESARVARAASGGQHGLAQSIFQVGGNAGSALGPLLAVYIVVPHGQGSIAWFSVAALVAMAVLSGVGTWYRRAHLGSAKRFRSAAENRARYTPRQITFTIAILISLLFSKFFYVSSLNTFYTFYLINKFHLSVQDAQLHLFLFLGAFAAGVLIGGPIGDRIGRKYVIWASILGVLPFTLMLPYANLFWTGVLTVIIGLVLASASSAIIVFAQEIVPGRVGLVSGLFFGLAFGLGGLGAAALGWLADETSITFVYKVCAFLPAIGLLTALLPDPRKRVPT